MYYYEVLAASLKYHGEEALTYSSEAELVSGSAVEVPLRSQKVLGIVVGPVKKPVFKVKSVEKSYGLPPLPTACLQLMEWLRSYYPAPLGVIANLFLPYSLVNNTSVDSKKIELAIEPLPKLTKEQSAVINNINSDTNHKGFLLHGDTGTGKTRVYQELAKQQLENGKSVLILTPEISLTPQLVGQFEKTFSNQTIVMHSNLTNKERREAWLTILQSQNPVVVIGPRSALFSPFNNLGLVVIDEAHESAYKQEQAPYYQSTRVAAKLAEVHNALFLMGSATPNVSDYFVANAKNMPILKMSTPAVKTASHDVKTEVIKANDKTLFNRNHYLSDKLLDAIGARLSKGEQSLVFLNRRGTARLVICQNCSWQALCPNCDLPLTFHSDGFIVRCHTCGYNTSAPTKCPVCASTDIIYKSMGTKAVVDSLKKLFPKAKIQRFDSDSKKSERFEQHYQSIAKGDVDILVGTQILVKGLDLPKLSLVGVVSADHSLSFPDYTAEERTYQQLSQILGRVGRGHIAGEAIIQTFHPDSLAIGAAVNKDWDIFYKSQIKEREKFLFPPFCYLLKLTCTRKSIGSAQQAALKLQEELRKLPLKAQIVGPSPSFYEKSAKGYSWQLVIKSKDRSSLVELIKHLPSGWSYDIDPADLL